MLKQTLSLLLSKFYSKQENATISNLSFPKENSVTTIVNEQPVNEWQSVCSFTAPSNGYLLAKGNKTPNAARMNIGIYCGEESIATGSESQNQMGLFIPLRKGAIAGVSANDVRALTVQFFESVGGGYKGIIRRAVLCLSSYSSYYLKHSLKPRKSGSGINPCRPIIPCHLRQFGMNGRLLPLLLTGIFTFIARTLQELISYAIVLGSSQVRIHKGYLGQLFHVVKESRLATLFIRTIATLFVRLFSLKLSAAKTQGGAL